MAGADACGLILYGKGGLFLPFSARPLPSGFLAALLRVYGAFGLQAAFRTIGLSLFCTGFLSPLPALAFYFPACPYTSLSTALRLAWRLLYFLDFPFLYGLFRGFARLRFPGLFYGLPIRPSRPKAPIEKGAGRQSPAKQRGVSVPILCYACAAASGFRAAKYPCLTLTMRLFSPFLTSF